MKSSPRHEFRAPNTLGGDLPDREGLTAGSFIPEIAQTFREKASLSSTVGDEREPTNSMYRRRNLDMCSIQKFCVAVYV